MMPGENQAKTAGVAPDGTAGTCQNCAVLNETLHEYMTSFLALKQKIIETDKILNEFKGKCDELQKSQRENAKLHIHLDELLLSIAPFDNLHKDDLYIQEELQTTKEFLKQCQDGSADLRNRNTEDQTLKDRIIFQLKILQDSNLKQSTEVTTLQNENKALEFKLHKTQEKLQILEKELSKEKKSTEVQTDRKELWSTLVQTDVAEKSNTTTQTDFAHTTSVLVQTDFSHMTSVLVQTDPTEESMIDLGKIRDFVAGLWHCVQPQLQSHSQSLSGNSPLFGWHSLPPELPTSQADIPIPKERLHASPLPRTPTAVPRTPPKTPARTAVRTPVKTPKGMSARTPERTIIRSPVQLTELRERSPSPAEMLELFRLLPPLLSPIHSPVHQTSSVEEDLQLSDDEEEREVSSIKQEEAKDVFPSNGLAMSSGVGPPDSPLDLKFHQTPCVPAQEGKAGERERDALALLGPVIGKKEKSFAPASSAVGAAEGGKMGAVAMETEVVTGERKPPSETCADITADITTDMEWETSAGNGLSSQAQSSDPNGPDGPRSCPAAKSATELRHSFGSTATNGREPSESEEDCAQLGHRRLRNSHTGLGSVSHTEMSLCNIDLPEEQVSHLKPSMTDFSLTLKPQVRDQVVGMGSKSPGKALGMDPLNGPVNGHHLDQNGLVNAPPSGGEENRHGENNGGLTNTLTRTKQKQSPPKHMHDGGGPALGEAEGQNGCPQTPVGEGTPHKGAYVDTESSEDLDYRTPRRKLRVAHSRREAQQFAGSFTGSTGTDETEENPSADPAYNAGGRTPARSYVVVISSADEDSDLTSTNTKRNAIKHSHTGLGDGLKNGQRNSRSSVEDGQVDVQAEEDQGTPESPSARLQEEDPRGSGTDTDSPDRPGVTNTLGPATGKHSAANVVHSNPPASLMSHNGDVVDTNAPASLKSRNDDVVHTNAPASLMSQNDDLLHTNAPASLKSPNADVVHTNGFGGPVSTEDEGIYTRVKAPEDSFRPMCVVPLRSPVDSVHNIRSMMGPPLRPLLPPLMTTPPKQGRLDLPSALIGHAASRDLPEGPVTAPSANLALRNGPQKITFSPAVPVPSTPSPCKSVPSSPLQFGSATPKHAVPVPCRHPASALNPASPAGPAPAPGQAQAQENSMQMLDSMYPELSAQARTLSILRGNVGSLVRPGAGPEPVTPPQATGGSGVHHPSSAPVSSSGFNSASTAFTKTQLVGKRCGGSMRMPESAKKLRLGNSPVSMATRPPSDFAVEPLPNDSAEPIESDPQKPVDSHAVKGDLVTKGENVASSKDCIIAQALAKLADSCFDLLVVLKSHVFVKRISSVPIMTDEEKEVVSDFGTTHIALIEDFLVTILARLKAERTTMGGDRLQSLCRVYTALCRQSKDRLKARTLAYSLLKEDFPEAAKLLLFMVSTWPSLFTHKTRKGLNRGIQAVAHAKAQGDVLLCLRHYLHWDSRPPCDIPQLINSTMAAMRSGERMRFQHHSRHGHDLCPTSWEYIFTLDLLCSHLKWKWTHDNIIRNDLWPIMNTWVTQKGLIPDVTVAAVLRLIGRLGQQGIKEKYSTAVQKMAAVINMLGKQGQAEGVLWEVQLAAAYAIYDLSPSNPKEALAALGAWRGEVTRPVPPAVTSCLTQISSLCRKHSS